MGSRIKEEQLRVKTLLSDTVSLLCKNGLSFKKNLKVQGLLGITVDDDEVFIVHLNETMGDLVSASDPDQTELRTPSKNSESGRRSPKRKRRRRSTDSNLSHGQSDNTQDQSDSVIDLDPDIVIKDDPDAIVLDEVKFEGNSSRRSCEFADEGLSHAIGSISSFSPGYTPGSGDTTGRPNQRGPDRFHPQRSSSHNTGGPLTTATSTSQPPYITGMMPNVADSDQSSASTSYPPWDGGHDNHGNIGQNLPGVSNWASQVTQQTMSQPPNMSQQPGPSQGYSPGQRTGTEPDTSMKGLFSRFNTNKECLTCQQVIRRQAATNKRYLMKETGVSESEWPKFTEKKLPSDRNCAICIKRLEYFTRRNHRQKKLKGKRK